LYILPARHWAAQTWWDLGEGELKKSNDKHHYYQKSEAHKDISGQIYSIYRETANSTAGSI